MTVTWLLENLHAWPQRYLLKHVCAVKVTRDEEELQKARLTIRRGAPLQDLSGKRGFPEDPRSRPVAPPTEQALR